MTEEELKKAMGKVIIVSAIVLVIMIILGIVVFNDFGKSTTIFENENQKAEFENLISDKGNENITKNEIAELENNVAENAVEPVPTEPEIPAPVVE